MIKKLCWDAYEYDNKHEKSFFEVYIYIYDKHEQSLIYILEKTLDHIDKHLMTIMINHLLNFFVHLNEEMPIGQALIPSSCLRLWVCFIFLGQHRRRGLMGRPVVGKWQVACATHELWGLVRTHIFDLHVDNTIVQIDHR